MGRNSAIKRYDATPAGQPMELFDASHGRRPIIIELLKSPWLVRVSDLSRHEGASAAKRVSEEISVEWDPLRQCPVSFRRTDRTYRVDGIIQVWATEKSWWDPRKRVARSFFRVLSRGGIYDLAFDRDSRSWLLVGVHD